MFRPLRQVLKKVKKQPDQNESPLFSYPLIQKAWSILKGKKPMITTTELSDIMDLFIVCDVSYRYKIDLCNVIKITRKNWAELFQNHYGDFNFLYLMPRLYQFYRNEIKNTPGDKSLSLTISNPELRKKLLNII